ncbi:DUF6234 family protein [Micromonospora avicenniae]|uniref:DUF6234 family protein n=1 Tax=Micromonospora avicenniae TaxID=1198245 RepID=UPI00343D4822
MDRRPGAPWAPGAVALLTVAWLVGAVVLLGWIFTIGIEGWADHYSDQGAGADALARKANLALLLLAAEVVAGPAVIAVVARGGLLRRTAAVYLVIALGLGLVAVPVAVGAYRELTPAPPPPPPPTICQEHSGGDTRCPGG